MWTFIVSGANLGWNGVEVPHHVKIGSEDTAVEVQDRGQDDSDQASLVTFPEEPGEITTTPRNAPPESTSQSGAPQTVRC